MEWSQWMTEYYRDNMEETIRSSLEKFGVIAEIHKEKVMAGGKEAEFYQCVCGERKDFFDGIFFEDVELIVFCTKNPWPILPYLEKITQKIM